MRKLIGEIPFWINSKEDPVSLYSSARISRNFRSVNYPSSLEYKSFRVVEKKAENYINALISSGDILKADLTSADPGLLNWMQKFRILPNIRKDKLSGIKMYYHHKYRAFLLINYMDHLTFFSHQPGRDIVKAYKSCLSFLSLFDDDQMSKDELGNYKTASISYFGSGLKLFSVVTLPVLRIKGKFDQIAGSLEFNKIIRTGYFGKLNNDLTVISNRDSFSESSAKLITHFKKILSGLYDLSKEETDPNNSDIVQIRNNCRKKINSEHLTFNDFIEIYYMLSYLRLLKASKIKITELNGQLAGLILDFPKNADRGVLKVSLNGMFLKKIEKNLSIEVKK
jgi:protein-arginine kinase